MQLLHYLLLYAILCVIDASRITNCSRNILRAIKKYTKTQSSVVLFTNDENSFEKTFIIQEIMKDVPSILVDVSQFHHTDYRKVLNLPFYTNPESTALYVALLQQNATYEDGWFDIKNLIDFITSISPGAPRPNFLLVFYSTKMVSEIFFSETFQYAWQNKYLDFSIINVNKKTKICSLRTFNPFFNTISNMDYNSDISIFPNKLRDMNRYPFKLAIINGSIYAPLTFFVNNTIYHEGQYVPIDPVISTTLKKLNVKIEPLLKNLDYANFLEYVITSSQNATIDMVNIQTHSYMQNITTNQNSIIAMDCENVVALVPVTSYTRFNITLNFLTHLVLVPSILMILMYVVQFLKITREPMVLTDSIRIITGSAIPHTPKTFGQRLIFGAFLVISLYYSVDLYSNLTDGIIVRGEVAYDTYQNLYESGFEIYLIEKNFEPFLHSDNEYIENIKNKAHQIDIIDDCIKNLLENKNVICITSFLWGRHVEENFQKERLLKIAKPSFACERGAISLGIASPYKRKIEHIFTRIHESGIWLLEPYTIFHSDINVHKVSAQRELSLENDVIRHYVYLMKISYLFCMAIFICEIIIHFIFS